MQNEVLTTTADLVPGSEVSFGFLITPHARAAVQVLGNTAHALGSIWRLYELTPAGAALVWNGTLSSLVTSPAQLTPNGGIETVAIVELRAYQPPTGFPAPNVTASLVGFDPDCCALPSPPVT